MGMINKGLLSSNTDLWSTPQYVFDRLNEKYRFTLDPCCTKENAKCPKFFTKEDNGLSKSWDGESVFMNPPYGRHIDQWMQKAYNTKGLVVCLIPSRTDTRWWHNYCMKADEIILVKGRLRFGGSKVNAPFPSAIVIFDKRTETTPVLKVGI